MIGEVAVIMACVGPIVTLKGVDYGVIQQKMVVVSKYAITILIAVPAGNAMIDLIYENA